jgi:Spy/CpxP family protein refolding chaperone
MNKYLSSAWLCSVVFCLLALSSFNAQAQTQAQAEVQTQAVGRLSEQAVITRNVGSSDALTVTREMTKRLRLNEGQFLHLLTLNRTKIARMNSINREYKDDEATRAAKISELEAQYEQECSRILTPSQLSQLQQDNGQPATPPAATGHGVG